MLAQVIYDEKKAGGNQLCNMVGLNMAEIDAYVALSDRSRTLVLGLLAASWSLVAGSSLAIIHLTRQNEVQLLFCMESAFMSLIFDYIETLCLFCASRYRSMPIRWDSWARSFSRGKFGFGLLALSLMVLPGVTFFFSASAFGRVSLVDVREFVGHWCGERTDHDIKYPMTLDIDYDYGNPTAIIDKKITCSHALSDSTSVVSFECSGLSLSLLRGGLPDLPQPMGMLQKATGPKLDGTWSREYGMGSDGGSFTVSGCSVQTISK